MRGSIIAVAILCAVVMSCKENDMKRVPDNAVLLGETVVVEVNGLRVGAAIITSGAIPQGARAGAFRSRSGAPGRVMTPQPSI
ncbi:MAG: hypothetical protein E4G96_05605 [Chrysiogenales bacterium]|nr:MAG: hypothetical protein E4G96_05605 [Chrysiogenales bacterium]